MAEQDRKTQALDLDAVQKPSIPTQPAAADVPDSSGATVNVEAPAAVRAPAQPMRGSWIRWAIPAGALVVGLLAGAGMGVAAGRTDPTTSQPYRSLGAQLSDVKAQLGDAQGQIGSARSAAASADDAAASANNAAQVALSAAAQSQAAVQQQQAAVASQQAALSSALQQVAATSISEGTWTVGVNVAPGTYRTQAAVSGDCYWEITRSGTNGGTIIKNDIVTGGFPTVTLSAGQDFKTERCGTWLKR